MGDGGVLFVGKVVAGATGGGKGGKTTRGPPKGETLKPGAFAKESIPAQPGRPTAAQQREVNALMKRNGCHTCGTKNPGNTSGNAVADHQPPKALAEPTEFLPHCIDCARRQGGEVVQALRARRKADR